MGCGKLDYFSYNIIGICMGKCIFLLFDFPVIKIQKILMKIKNEKKKIKQEIIIIIQANIAHFYFRFLKRIQLTRLSRKKILFGLNTNFHMKKKKKKKMCKARVTLTLLCCSMLMHIYINIQVVVSQYMKIFLFFTYIFMTTLLKMGVFNFFFFHVVQYI